MDIVDLVNYDSFQKPFEPIIRKIDRQIGRRPRFVFQNGVIVEQDTSRPTPEMTETDFWQKPHYSRPMSPNLSDLPTLDHNPNKQNRIISIADKLSELTSTLQEKRRAAVSHKFEALEDLIERINAAKLKESLKKLIKELSHQEADLLIRKSLKPNYATMRRYLQSNFPAAIQKTEALAIRMAKQAAFSNIKAESCFRLMEVTRCKLKLQGAFASLLKNREEEKKSRESEKVLSFVMKLDTYLLLLKFNAFYSLKADQV